jgi:tetratricopeptide (TPR) repeat protein
MPMPAESDVMKRFVRLAREPRTVWFPICLAALVGLLAPLGCAKKMVVTTADTDSVPESRAIEHQVVAGETLALIADNYYGDPERYQDIARLNGITDPERIVPGSLLQLRFDADEWDAARKRAAALVPYNRGVDLLEQERLGEAEKQFLLALDTAPDLASARYNLALVYLKRARYEEALPLLADLIAQRPRATDFRFAYGHALFLSARFDEAAQQFRAVLEVNPSHKRAMFGLARSLQEGGYTDPAITAWQDYLAQDSTSSWAATARRNLRKLQDDGQQ